MGFGSDYDDVLEGGFVEMTVCDIQLEDLIRFQQIKFKVLGGHFYASGKEYAFREIVTKLYEARKEHKAEANALEIVEKLILNSAYGKTIQNPISSFWKFFDVEDVDHHFDYWVRHQNEILFDKLIHDKTRMMQVLQPIGKHFNLSIIGILIPAMSKRIMNEVMCLGEDIGGMISSVLT
jgi:hypothetical protein